MVKVVHIARPWDRCARSAAPHPIVVQILPVDDPAARAMAGNGWHGCRSAGRQQPTAALTIARSSTTSPSGRCCPWPKRPNDAPPRESAPGGAAYGIDEGAPGMEAHQLHHHLVRIGGAKRCTCRHHGSWRPRRRAILLAALSFGERGGRAAFHVQPDGIGPPGTSSATVARSAGR